MEIRVAKTAGFCFGVERAVARVESLLQQGKTPLYTYGPIIHNETVVEELEAKGVRILADEAALEALERDPQVLTMAEYPYDGSVRKIGDMIVVRLG